MLKHRSSAVGQFALGLSSNLLLVYLLLYATSLFNHWVGSVLAMVGFVAWGFYSPRMALKYGGRPLAYGAATGLILYLILLVATMEWP
jgi:hypothetical protein